MDNKTINLNPDPLAEMEKKLRTIGAWADHRHNKGMQHYFIARNPSVNTAISLCREVISTFDNLTLTELPSKCFVCSLLSISKGKELDKQENNNSNVVKSKRI